MTEQTLHENFAEYLIAQYPRAVFRSDLGGYTKRQTAVQKSPGYPDVTILVPVPPYHACLIELKDGLGKLFNQDGSVAKKRRQAHTQQAATLWYLFRHNYFCDFATSFEEARRIADSYLDPEAVNWRPSYATKLLDYMFTELTHELFDHIKHPYVYAYWEFRHGRPF